MIRLSNIFKTTSKFTRPSKIKLQFTPASASQSGTWKSAENRAEKIKRLQYQSKARTISTKPILVTWLDKNMETMTEEGLNDYDDLLNYDYNRYDEYSLLNWILGVEEAPVEYRTEVLVGLMNYASKVRFGKDRGVFACLPCLPCLP
jgi:succinate dehydrogenase flavin-adding protein (antitoxin of CptAB toxin-antitoxin module)